MAEALRSFQIPKTSSPEQTEELLSCLRQLTRAHERLASIAPATAVLKNVRQSENSVLLTYDLDEVKPLGVLILGQRPEQKTLIRWARQLCATLAAVYPAGQAPLMKHGGICPSSIMVGPNGELRVLDFGVAECFSAMLEATDEAWLHQVASHVAPEIWNAPSRFNEQSDIFAVGVLLYELATGQHPFGAVRDDPDDCKYQILVEVPVAPHKRRSALNVHFSEIIHKAIRSEPDKRYHKFSSMLEDIDARCQVTSEEPQDETLSPHLRQKVPRVEDPRRPPGTPGDSQRPVEEEARLKYLEEQSRLRAQRERAEQKLQVRQDHARQLRVKIRRHAAFISAVFIAAVILTSISAIYGIRSVRKTAGHDAVGALMSRLNESLHSSSGDALGRVLNLQNTPGGLERAVRELNKVAPKSKFTYQQLECSDLLCSAGAFTVLLDEGDELVGMRFTQAPGDEALQIDFDSRLLVDSIRRVVSRHAARQVTPQVRELAVRIEKLFGSGKRVDQLGVLLEKLGLEEMSLGYLSYQASTKQIELSPSYSPVPGEDALRFGCAVLDSAGGEMILAEELSLLFHFECPSGAPCRVTELEILPEAEPRAHRGWCMTTSLRRIQEAFEEGDTARLAGLTGSDVDEIQRTFTWASQCRSARLMFFDVDVNEPQAAARIEYQPGKLSEQVFATGELFFFFREELGWNAQVGSGSRWPDRPAPFVRQALGKKLLDRFQKAWKQRDAHAYLQLFEGTPRSVESITAMFAAMDQHEADFSIQANEVENSQRLLDIQVKPIRGDRFATKNFRYQLAEGTLRWNGGTDPLWTVSGQTFRNLSARLLRATWNDIEGIRKDFLSTGPDELAGNEAAQLEDWIGAVEQAREMFVPLSNDYFAGFPKRVQLRRSPGNDAMEFSRVRLAPPKGNLLYMLEREVQIHDIEPLWKRGDRPWEVWRSIVGSPPDEQVVGLTLEEARDFAQKIGCQIPSVDEWNAARAQLSESRGMNFDTGVWELCIDQNDPQVPVGLGGSWYASDPDLTAAGIRFPAEQVRLDHPHGTVGFRVCCRFNLPADAIDWTQASAADARVP